MSRALAARRVLVTRRWPELVAALSAAGADVAEVPALELAPPEDPAPLDDALRGLARYAWIVFTSASAVEAVATRMTALGLSMPAVRMASVGPATTRAISAAWPGARIEVQPADQFRGEELVKAFAGQAVAGRKVFLPVSDRAADTVARGLAALGAQADRIVAYRTVGSGSSDRLRGELGKGADAAVFASPSAVEAFLLAAGEAGRQVPAVAIGPTTAAAACAAGLELLATAKAPTAEGVMEALVRAWGA